MTDSTIRGAFWLGVRDALPFLLVIVPFGMLFGVLAAEAGWPVAETMAASILVIAGAYEDWRARWVYRSSRTELFALLDEAGFDRDLVLIRIKDDDDIANVARQLKLDRRPVNR